MWYPPESHPAYVARRVAEPSGSVLSASGVRTVDTPVQVEGPGLDDQPSPAGTAYGPSSASGPFTSLRVVGLAALALSFVGMFMPWATTDAAVSGLHVRSSVVGIDLGTGHLLCAVLTVVLLLSWWHLVDTGRSTGIALFACWLAALGLGVYEIVDIISVPTHGLFALDIGVGLSLCGFAALVGTVCSAADAAQLWPGAGSAGPTTPGVVWVCGLIALVVMTAASYFGYVAGTSPVGPVPVLSPGQPFDGGPHSSGPAGGGSTGGSGSSGNSGNIGNSGSVGDSGNSGPSGTTGSSGNTGPGGGLGNSGVGNSGSGLFGNSGSGGLGQGPFGNSGAGNSGP